MSSALVKVNGYDWRMAILRSFYLYFLHKLSWEIDFSSQSATSTEQLFRMMWGETSIQRRSQFSWFNSRFENSIVYTKEIIGKAHLAQFNLQREIREALPSGSVSLHKLLSVDPTEIVNDDKTIC